MNATITTPVAAPATKPKLEGDTSRYRFDYFYSPISDLQVVEQLDPASGKEVIDHILVKDEPVQSSQRFWTSLHARYGFNSAFRKYFSHAETFDRIASVEGNDRLRLCIQRDIQSGESTLMAVSNPKRPIAVYEDLVGTLGDYHAENVSYSNGIVQSLHTPRASANQFQVFGEDHQNKFVMHTPVDGYGSPSIYLSLLRMVCSNGMIAMAKAFRSQLAMGKGVDDVTPTLIRALDGFNNDEGYAALRQRLEAAGTSWASVLEAQKVYQALIAMHHKREVSAHVFAGAFTGDLAVPQFGEGSGQHSGVARLLAEDAASRQEHGVNDLSDALLGKPAGVTGSKGLGSPLLTAFHRLTGDVSQSYGLANLDALSPKRQRALPVQCSVYELMNFMTEVATHHANTAGNRRLQGLVGTMLTEEYDMEGTKEQFTEFGDFLIDTKFRNNMTGS